jgi:hypothetical protein
LKNQDKSDKTKLSRVRNRKHYETHNSAELTKLLVGLADNSAKFLEIISSTVYTCMVSHYKS